MRRSAPQIFQSVGSADTITVNCPLSTVNCNVLREINLLDRRQIPCYNKKKREEGFYVYFISVYFGR